MVVVRLISPYYVKSTGLNCVFNRMQCTFYLGTCTQCTPALSASSYNFIDNKESTNWHFYISPTARAALESGANEIFLFFIFCLFRCSLMCCHLLLGTVECALNAGLAARVLSNFFTFFYLQHTRFLFWSGLQKGDGGDNTMKSFQRWLPFCPQLGVRLDVHSFQSTKSH